MKDLVTPDYIYSVILPKLKSICIAGMKRFPNYLLILNEDVYTDYEPDDPHISFKSLGLDWEIQGNKLEFIFIKDYESVLCNDYYLAGELCFANKLRKDCDGVSHAYLSLVSRIKYKKDDIPYVSYKPNLYLRLQNKSVFKTEELLEENLDTSLKNLIVNLKTVSKGKNMILVQKDNKRVVSNLNKKELFFVEDISSSSHLNNLINNVTEKEKQEGNVLEYIVGLFEHREYKEDFDFFKRYWYEDGINKVGYTVIMN